MALATGSPVPAERLVAYQQLSGLRDPVGQMPGSVEASPAFEDVASFLPLLTMDGLEQALDVAGDEDFELIRTAAAALAGRRDTGPLAASITDSFSLGCSMLGLLPLTQIAALRAFFAQLVRGEVQP
jgi:hypothetical protein